MNMSIHDTILNLKAQIIEAERLLSIAGEHPMMTYSLGKRLEILREELSEIEKNNVEEAKLRLLFSGKAVLGSIGIKADFVSKTIKPIQELIKTQTAIIKSGNDIGKRGKVKKGSIAELYLTALPTGSFGYELSMLEGKELFDEEDVSNSIREIIDMIEAASESDDAFQKVIENSPKRTLIHLNTFFKELANEESILKMESGDKYVELSEDKVKLGYQRVSSAQYQETPIQIAGVFKGILLDSGKFEITDEDGKKYSGYLSEDLSEDEAINYNKEYTNEKCSIMVQENVTTFSSGYRKISYELIQIKSL